MNRGQGLDLSENTNWTGNGKNYFLGIGIDHYLHWENLSNAVKDVNDLITVLTTQYQFEPDEIHTLFDTTATEANIYNKIRELKRIIRPEDNLLVYYSGHGHYDEEFEEGYWIPVDAEKSTEDRFISNANIIKRINAIDTHHTLLIVDSCFSGTLVVKKRSGLTDERFKSRRILASGRQETVVDGAPGENSPFASGILTYLKKNTEKAINTTSLVQYVKDFVETRARQTPVEGRIQNSADEGGEFVFHLKLDEITLWESIQQQDNADAYANYLDYYPKGLYANQAQKRILQLKEDDIWRSAKIKDSELAYENYLKKYYPGGKYIQEANERLHKLQTAQKDRREALDEMAKKDEERDRIRREYDGFIAEAEQLFANKELPQAREKYRAALRYYLPGFVPNTEYVEEQINFCSNGITFLNYYENGRRAMDNYNYRLALQYFGEALKVDDNPKVEDLISYCRLKLKEAERGPQIPAQPVTKTVTVQKTVPQRAVPADKTRPKRKRPAFVVPVVIIGTILLIVFVIAVIYEMENYDDSYPPSEQQNSYDYTADEDTAPDVISDPVNPPKASMTYDQLILGNWQLSRFYSRDPNAQAWLQTMSGMQATYSFFDGGHVTISSNFGVSNYLYYLSGDQISIPGAVPSASISRLDRRNLEFTGLFTDGVYSYTITFEFKKMD